MTITHEHIRTAGGIVNAFGNIFFTNLDKLNAAVAAATPVQEPVNQQAHEMALRQWESWKQYALELQEKLVKYEGGTPMVLNTTPPAAPVQEPVIADGLPKLPEPAYRERSYAGHGNESVGEYFSAHQVQEYASGVMYFYKRRCDALQKWQSKMRDPERTIVCDILANGCTLEPAGDRYTPPAAQPAVPLTRERVKEILSEAGYDTANAEARADFINGIRHGEAAHGITAPAQKGGEA